MDHRRHKKNLIISYKNLTDELRDLFKEAYPEGYNDYLQKTIKPNGEPIFVVPLETEETMYMVKFDVKIDSGMLDDDPETGMYGDDKGDDGEFAPLSEAIDKEEGNSKVGVLKHGAYDDIDISSQEMEMVSADMEAEFGDTPDDEYDDYVGEDDRNEEEDEEPSDDELFGLNDDDFLNDVLNDDPTSLETKKKSTRKSTAKAPAEKAPAKRGRKSKAESEAPAEAPAKRGRKPKAETAASTKTRKK